MCPGRREQICGKPEQRSGKKILVPGPPTGSESRSWHFHSSTTCARLIRGPISGWPVFRGWPRPSFHALVDAGICPAGALGPFCPCQAEGDRGGARMLREAGPWDLGFCLPNSLSSGWSMFRAGSESAAAVRDGRGSSSMRGCRRRRTGPRIERRSMCACFPTAPGRNVPWCSSGGALPMTIWPREPPGVLERFDAVRNWPDAEPMDLSPRPVLGPGATGTRAESRRSCRTSALPLARRTATDDSWMDRDSRGVDPAKERRRVG